MKICAICGRIQNSSLHFPEEPKKIPDLQANRLTGQERDRLLNITYLYTEVNIVQPLPHIKAGASLMHTRQVTVADNDGIGILIGKRLQQIEH